MTPATYDFPSLGSQLRRDAAGRHAGRTATSGSSGWRGLSHPVVTRNAFLAALNTMEPDESGRGDPANRFDVHALDAPHLGPRHPRPLVRVRTSLIG